MLVRTTREFLEQPPRLAVAEDHLYLTNLRASHKDGSPEALLAIARGHWEIENGLHWVKDTTMREDACHLKGGAACTLAVLRNIVIFLLTFVAGDSVPQKQLLLHAKPSLAKRLVSIKRRPRKQVGKF